MIRTAVSRSVLASDLMLLLVVAASSPLFPRVFSDLLSSAFEAAADEPALDDLVGVESVLDHLLRDEDDERAGSTSR